MPLDKLVDSAQLDSDLEDVADAIRAKSGGSSRLVFPAGFVSEIQAIQSGGGEAVLINKTISSNGTYNASDDSADGFKKVVANVPNTYAAGDEGKVVSSGALVSQTAHATVTQNGTYDTTLNNSVEVAVPGITVTNGVIPTAFNNGSMTSADVYALTEIWKNALHAQTNLEAVSIKTNPNSVRSQAFRYTKLVEINLPVSVTQILDGDVFRDNTSLLRVFLPGVTTINGQYNFAGSTNLQVVQLGSVGHAFTTLGYSNSFNSSHTALTITFFTTGDDVDTMLAKIRNGASNATIVVKASENTTYGGNSFSAGDTILTSTP